MHGVNTATALKLPATLGLDEARNFLGAMRQHAEGRTLLRVDAAAVETLTLACVQIMLAAAREHGRIAATNASPAFLAAFEELGVNWSDFLDVIEAIDDSAPAIAAAPADLSDEAAPPPTSEESMTKRIMTIDDSKTMRDMLMLTLAEAGFDVLQAVDGQDGLDKLEGEQVDVVITDINMPRMDGYEVIRQLRKKPAFRSTPILVLTTESEAEKRNMARDAGATGWLVKPFDPERLIETVRKVAP